jgi:hypothetical protein
MKKGEELSRRSFLFNTALATIGIIGASRLLTACAGNVPEGLKDLCDRLINILNS